MRRSTLTVFAFFFGLLVGCDSGRSSSAGHISGSEVRQKVGEAAGAVGRYVSQEKDALIEELNKRLREADVRIDELKQKLAATADAAKPELQKQIDKLSSKRDEYRKKVEQLKDSAGDAWKELRDGASNAWWELKKGLDSAAEK